MPTSKTALRRRYIRFYGQCIQRRLDDMLTAFVFSIGKAYSYVYLDARYERVLRMVWSAHRQCLSLLVLMSVGIVQYWLWDSP